MKTFLTTLVLIFSTAAFAQTSYLELILNYNKTNFNYGSLESELKDYKEDLWGIQAGVSYQSGVTNYFSVVPELYFMAKGGKLKENNPLNGRKTRTRMFTVEMPVMARFHLCNFYLNAGPYVGYNFSGKEKVKGVGTTKIKFKDGANDFKRWDFGIQFGGGYEYKLKSSRIAVDLRFHRGLTDLSNLGERYNRFYTLSLTWSKALKSNWLVKRKDQ